MDYVILTRFMPWNKNRKGPPLGKRKGSNNQTPQIGENFQLRFFGPKKMVTIIPQTNRKKLVKNFLEYFNRIPENKKNVTNLKEKCMREAKGSPPQFLLFLIILMCNPGNPIGFFWHHLLTPP